MLDVGSTEISRLAHDFGAVSRKKSITENHWPLGAEQVYPVSDLERCNFSYQYFRIYENPF